MSKLFSDLEKKIQEQSQKYYEDGSNDLTDSEFDTLVDQLKIENPQSELLKTGWGYDVSKDKNSRKKFNHKYGLVGSLDKCHNWQELSTDLKDTDIWVSLKLDGISVVLYYENGNLVRALTRGDGYTGIDITNKIKNMVPYSIDNTFTGAVRGEIIMSFSNFEKYIEIHPDAKNPRNTVAGLIGSKDIVEDLKYLDILVYTIIADESDSLYTMVDVIEFLRSNFLNVAPYSYYYVDENNFASLMKSIHDEYESQYSVPTDGLVLSTNTIMIDPESHYISYNSQAFKFPAESKETIVKSVIWDMSKTGYAIPRIHFDKLQLSGTDVEFATGFNAKYILDNNIGVGTKVVVTKRGEIIPYIVKIVQATHADIIYKCPYCDNDLVFEGVHLVCNNINCPNMVEQDTLCWLNNLVPLDNFGDTLRLKYLRKSVVPGKDITIETIMEGFLNPFIDQLNVGVQDRLFSTMCNKLYNDRFSLKSAIAALNIPRFGDVTCKKLAQYPDLVKTLMDSAISNTSPNTLKFIDSYIGNANGESIRKHLSKFKRLKYIWDRIDLYTDIDIKKKVCITGTLSVKRSDFEKELNEHGYELSSSVTRDTICLITNVLSGTSSKHKQATKLGIVKLTEAQFREKYFN